MPDGWTTEDSSLLLELQSLWQGKYTIKVNGDGVWSGQRTSGATTVTADSGRELQRKLVSDAVAWNNETFRKHQP